MQTCSVADCAWSFLCNNGCALMCNNICAALQHKQFSSTTSHPGPRFNSKVWWRIKWQQTFRQDIVKTFLIAFLSSQSVLVNTSSPHPLTATLIKLFSQKRFVLTWSLSSQQLCLLALFKKSIVSYRTLLSPHHHPKNTSIVWDCCFQCDLWFDSLWHILLALATQITQTPVEKNVWPSQPPPCGFGPTALLFSVLLLSNFNCSHLHF